MNLLRGLQSALINLRVNKMRSMLTMLGVIIGVSAVIIMVALVEGVRSRIVAEFQRLGSDLIIIAYEPDYNQLQRSHRIRGLTMDDVRAIKSQCDLLGNISSELPFGNNMSATHLGNSMKLNANGVESEYPRLRNVTVVSGRFILPEDVSTWAKVAVIGDKVKTELFKDEDPVGKQMEIQGVSITVIGVMKPKGKSGPEDPDKTILMPISTAQKRFVGTEMVGVIFAQPKAGVIITDAMDQVWHTLMRLHDNAEGFKIDSQQNILETIGRILTLFSLVLGGVAGLALLVGGIGVMNIMLVSVTERTREIGVRKAVGAKKKDILLQFLIESATVTGVGGLMGIALGAGVAYGVGALSAKLMPGGMGGEPGIPIHLPLWSIFGAFGFSAFIGIFFGMYPAMRAANLNPIDALRHE